MALGDAYAVVGTGTSGTITAEAVLVTTPVQPATAEGGSGNLLLGSVTAPAAAATATVRVRVRQNTIAGTAVFDSGVLTVGTAAVGITVPIAALDAAAAATGVAVYVVTVLSTGGTGAGTLGTLAVIPAGANG